jgi:D-glycero-alpha-D-manno-heptose-7-phosphate kinase
VIISRTPMRLPLGGGGTDLPSFYQKHGATLLTAAIDKYMYIELNRPAVDPSIRLRYSRTEIVDRVADIQHDLAREALKLTGVDRQIEISSMADFPAGTGMGSSGSYTVGLLKALHTLNRRAVDTQELAEQACHIEMNILKRPVGKQDQYAAAFGGVISLDIEPDGSVRVTPLDMHFDTIKEFENDVLLYYTHIQRDGAAILENQARATERSESEVVDRLKRIREIGYQVKEALRAGDLVAFGHLLDLHWQTKRGLGSGVSNSQIERWYTVARNAGALGGKLMGAGGGGCFMFCCPGDKRPLRAELAAEGLQELHYRLDFVGSKVLLDA